MKGPGLITSIPVAAQRRLPQEHARTPVCDSLAPLKVADTCIEGPMLDHQHVYRQTDGRVPTAAGLGFGKLKQLATNAFTRYRRPNSNVVSTRR